MTQGGQKYLMTQGCFGERYLITQQNGHWQRIGEQILHQYLITFKVYLMTLIFSLLISNDEIIERENF